MIEDMQFPQSLIQPVNQLHVWDINQLANSEVGQYRRYMQLKPGELDCRIKEVKLDGVVLLREKLNVGIQIEAAPPAEIVPLAAILSNTQKMRFCGKPLGQHSLMQATGNEWNVCATESLDYVGCVMERGVLEYHSQNLIGRAPSAGWFVSQRRQVEPMLFSYYQQWLLDALALLERKPELILHEPIRRQLSGQIFQLAVKLLCSAEQIEQKVVRFNRRVDGVRKVVEYLQVHAQYLPTMSELCKVACLSERSLEYGFREQFGVTPVRYLKVVRLNGARRELVVADASSTKVVDIALRWGFVELGRFSGEYNKLFNQLPSHTLRSH
jgi:AraC family ethanolamine operon transcriptional activator